MFALQRKSVSLVFVLLGMSLSFSVYSVSCRSQYLYGLTCTSLHDYASRSHQTIISKYQCKKNGRIIAKPTYYYICRYGKPVSAYTLINGNKYSIGVGKVPDHARKRCNSFCY